MSGAEGISPEIRSGSRKFKTIVKWRVLWLTKHTHQIKKFEYDCKYLAYRTMCQFLRFRRCSWIEKLETTVKIVEED